MRLRCVVVFTAFGFGCGNGDEPPPTVETPGGCLAGEWRRDDGSCVAAGLPPDMPCPPGEWLRNDDGACIAAGVPADGCGEGFVHDGDRGCDPILPPTPCPPGLMAVPGETVCREVAPCGSHKWGEIPIEPDTEHVDGSYPGTDSDGSALKPWKSIQDGVDHATPGAIVAVAAGSYVEDVTVFGKPVRLWGVCPRRVEVVATGANLSAIEVQTGAVGTEVRDLAVTGDAVGVSSFGSLDVLVERVWVHDNGGRGVNVQNDYGPTSITVRGSLLEHNNDLGIFARANPATGDPSTLLLRTSLVDHNQDYGLLVEVSTATVEASVIRDTLPTDQGRDGRGVEAHGNPATSEPSTLVIERSLVSQSHEVGVFVQGSIATVEASVVRDTQPTADGDFGSGVVAQAFATTGAPSTLVLKSSLVERNHETGVFAGASEATVEASVVRDTQPNDKGLFGRGISAQAHETTAAPSTLWVRTSLIEHNHKVGMFIAGSQATVEASVVRDTIFGRGVSVQADPTIAAPSAALLRAVLIEQNHDVGLYVSDSRATVEASVVSGTATRADGRYGDGVAIFSEHGPASVSLQDMRIADSARGALATFGASLRYGHSDLRCQAFDLIGEAAQTGAYLVENLGDNRCGCPSADGECILESAGFEPPPPL